jgi:glutamate synthase domain-containing protein 3
LISKKNEEILATARQAIEEGTSKATISISVGNFDHAIGATLAGEIARNGRFGKDSTIEIKATGYAGQGFAFAATEGMAMRLEGYANDGPGEAMGRSAHVVITPPPGTDHSRIPHLVGNAAAYGASGGKLYIAGRVGQRFGVRNSGALLICEGVGKYAFEYMTGGIGVVLGKCGACIGSGMTGGELYLYDPDGESRSHLHPDTMVREEGPPQGWEMALKTILMDFFEETKSPRAGNILEGWKRAQSDFILVQSKQVLARIS